MTILKLTKRQQELLYMDTYAERPEDDTQDARGRHLRDELRAGRMVTATPWLLSELSEFSDRDDSYNEQRVYRHLYRKVAELLKVR